MGRMINWNDEYCPNGHKWVFCGSSTLYPDFYYCEADDRFWEPTVRPINPQKVAKQYHGHRLDEMKQYALREQGFEALRYKLNFEQVIDLANMSRETITELLKSAQLTEATQERKEG